VTTPSPSAEPSLATLLTQLCARDEAAATDFDRLWRPRLVRFCAGYLKSRDETEDAVQDVIAKVLAVHEQPDEPRVWLYRIARNHCLNLLRSRNAQREESLEVRVPDPIVTLEGGPDPEQHQEHRVWEHEQVRRLDRSARSRKHRQVGVNVG